MLYLYLRTGNSKGLLVPMSTTDQELQHLRNALSDDIRLKRIDERLSALGNVIACNDHVAILHPDLDKVTLLALLDRIPCNFGRIRQLHCDNGNDGGEQ